MSISGTSEAMEYFHTCSCSGGGIENFLNCAPCPPSVLTYLQLKTIAIGKLCQKEVCSIARRCRMKESQELTSDCPEREPPGFKCDLICTIIIVVVLVAALTVILIVVVFRRKKTVVKQDTIQVVFNDTDSEASDKSSDRGSVKVARKQANGPKCNDGLDIDKSSHKPEDILDRGTTVVGATIDSNGNSTSINGTQNLVQNDLDKNEDVSINDIHVTVNGGMSMMDMNKNDSCITAKL